MELINEKEAAEMLNVSVRQMQGQIDQWFQTEGREHTPKPQRRRRGESSPDSYRPQRRQRVVFPKKEKR